MANFNEAIRWSNETPVIYLTTTYSKYRSGANMVYNVGLSISTVTGSYYFGFPIYAKIYVNGESNPRYTVTLKNSSPSRWSTPITYSTGDFTVENKTTGVTSLAVNLYSSSGIRNETYYFDMGVDPAYFTNQPTLTLQSKTETSITYKWATSETCDNIVWHGTGTASTTGLSGTTGTVTFSGLTANTSYQHYGTFRRKDSGLTTDSNKPTNSTDNYPYVSGLTPEVITLGETDIQGISISNPHNRETTINIRLNDASGELLASTTTTDRMILFSADPSTFYPLIPNSPNGTLYYYCVYNNHTTAGITGTFKINGNERPTFPTSSWSYAANLTSLTNDNQIIIDGYSDVTITIDTPATSDYNANITSYYAKWGDVTNNNLTPSNPVTLTGGTGTSLIVLANDSRNLQSPLGASTLDITSKRVLYTKPVVNVSETHRLNGIDTLVTLNATGTMYKGTFGANGVQNAIASVGYRVKGVGQPDSAYSQLYPISLNNCYFDSSTGEWTISNASIHQNGQSGGFPSGSSYNVKLEFYDAQGLLGYGTYVSTVEDGTLARDVFKDSDGEYHEGINGLADDDYTQTIHGKINVTDGYYLNGELFEGGGGGGDTVPVGLISAYPVSTAPHGWLLCDGSAVSRTTYKELFDVIGTSHGSGDGSTTFNLPYMPGNTIVGVDTNDSNFNAAGKTYGEKTHTLTIDEMPSHDHKARFGDTAGGDGSGYRFSNTSGTNRVMIENEGGGQAHNNIQPSIAEYYMIKAFKVSVPGHDLGDTLPIGSVIDYDGDTVPDGYEEVEDDTQPKLEVKTYTKNCGVINGGADYVSNIQLESGYTYLGIVGTNLWGGMYTWLITSSNYIVNNTAITVLHNSSGSNTDAITLTLYVLRYKN